MQLIKSTEIRLEKSSERMESKWQEKKQKNARTYLVCVMYQRASNTAAKAVVTQEAMKWKLRVNAII
jgi:hypothetical protein